MSNKTTMILTFVVSVVVPFIQDFGTKKTYCFMLQRKSFRFI